MVKTTELIYVGEVVANTTSHEVELLWDPVIELLHNRKYVCRATSKYGTQEQSIILNVTGEITIANCIETPITVFPSSVPISPIEVFIQENGSTLAGGKYKLICNVTTIEGVVSSPTVQWLNQSDGEIIQNSINGDITVDPPEIQGRTTLLPLLFTVLRAQYSGEYVCHASLPLLPLTDPLIVNTSQALDVQSEMVSVNIYSFSLKSIDHCLLVCIIMRGGSVQLNVHFGSISLQH